jgi:hypothetical protein
MRRVAPLALARILLAAAALSVVVLMTAGAADPTRWLHVRVLEGENGETVRVNLPMKMIEALLPSFRSAVFEHGKLDAGHLDEVDLRAILAAVRDGEDGEYVTVDSAKEKVRVAKEKNLLLVHVEDTSSGDKEEVHARIRMEVVEALLSGEGDELDVAAALKALAAQPDETVELVSAVDGESTVRIWIDSQNSAD